MLPCKDGPQSQLRPIKNSENKSKHMSREALAPGKAIVKPKVPAEVGEPASQVEAVRELETKHSPSRNPQSWPGRTQPTSAAGSDFIRKFRKQVFFYFLKNSLDFSVFGHWCVHCFIPSAWNVRGAQLNDQMNELIVMHIATRLKKEQKP